MFKKIILWIMRLAVITFIFYYGWFLPTLKWEGRDFPQESEIQYSEGRFFLIKYVLQVVLAPQQQTCIWLKMVRK